ncbi:hypothetical protein KIPB_002440, partial [Kipferlia bialata]
QSDCRFAVSVVPPAPGSDPRESPIVYMRAQMCGFRLTADKQYPITTSFTIPQDKTDVYVYATSDKEGAHDRENSESETSESSLSLLSLQNSGMHSGLHGSVPGLHGLDSDHASIPVVLSGRQLGRVTLNNKVGAEHWVSAGAHFQIL